MILSQPGAWSAQPSGQLSGPCSHADTGAATRAMCAALLRVTDRPTRWQPSRRAHPHRPPSGSRTSQRHQQARSRSAGGCRGGVGGVSDHIVKRGGRLFFLSKGPHIFAHSISSAFRCARRARRTYQRRLNSDFSHARRCSSRRVMPWSNASQHSLQ